MVEGGRVSRSIVSWEASRQRVDRVAGVLFHEKRHGRGWTGWQECRLMGNDATMWWRVDRAKAGLFH
jgi:hypothetical protein